MAPAALKNTADPPGASAVSPNGVYTESSAIEPTTSRLTSHPIRGAEPQDGEARVEDPAPCPPQHRTRRPPAHPSSHNQRGAPAPQEAARPGRAVARARRLADCPP